MVLSLCTSFCGAKFSSHFYYHLLHNFTHLVYYVDLRFSSQSHAVCLTWVYLQRRAVFDALLRCAKPSRLSDLYAFISGPSKFKNINPKVRLLNEYFRLIGKLSRRASLSMIDDGSFTLSNELWRITGVNSKYSMCQSYPFAMIVPKCIRHVS